MTCQNKAASSLSRYCWAKHPRLARFAEQCRIVAKVDQLMAWVDALETQLATSRTTAEDSLSALGAELTPNP
jgi:hypothetical protein